MRRKTEILILCTALAVTAITSGCQIKAREQEPPTITTSAATSNEAETPATEPTSEDGTKAVEEISAPKMERKEISCSRRFYRHPAIIQGPVSACDRGDGAGGGNGY